MTEFTPFVYSAKAYNKITTLKVGVAFMVGGLFMAMVGMEILCDKMVDRYREFFKKPKQLPDVERLHPAELVGTFSRYK